MLEIKQIETFYPEALRPFKKNLLREYLQYKILEVIFSSPLANTLSFMGGTAIRIIHSNSRFSEDLDFDNRSLDRSGFERLTGLIQKRLSREGYEVEMKNVLRTGFHSSIRIPGILLKTGISGHKDEKLTIQVDSEPQNFSYTPEKILINKFDVFFRVQVVPVDILLAQKITCLFTRKRPLGRDFYDIIFLMAKTKSNLDYIQLKTGLATPGKIKKQILLLCKGLDFKRLSREVAPFLMNKNDAEKILAFPEYIRTVNF
jgi:predicted nucleotidyltransferase component of viral defense system